MPNNNETYITGLRVVKGRKKSQCLNLSNARIKSYADIEQMTEEELQGVIICPDYPLEDGHLVPASAIGYEDGTVEDALDDLYEAGNVRYNSETDRFEVKINGTWVPSVKAYAQDELFYKDGQFYVQGSNGVYKNADNIPTSYAFATTGNVLTANTSPMQAPSAYTFVFDNLVDVSGYSKLVIESNVGNVECDMSNASGSGYVAIAVQMNSSGSATPYSVRGGVFTTKQYFENNIIVYNDIRNLGPASAPFTISKVYLVK